MNLFWSVRTIADAPATGSEAADWDAAIEATESATDPGPLDFTDIEHTGYAADVRDVCDCLATVVGVEFDVPGVVEVQDRYHWIDANMATFRRMMVPFEEHSPTVLPGFTRVANTGSPAFVLSFLGNSVLGQYDLPLLTNGDDDHGLYSVHPSIRWVAGSLDVDYPRFRCWIIFHEVSYAAELGAAPWLSTYLGPRMQCGIDAFADDGPDRDVFRELGTMVAAVEGYAELLMDQALDDDYEDLRRKPDGRRQDGGPVVKLARRLLRLGLKRRQYECGVRFFEHVIDECGVAVVLRVWGHPENLPIDAGLDAPERWVAWVLP